MNATPKVEVKNAFAKTTCLSLSRRADADIAISCHVIPLLRPSHTYALSLDFFQACAIRDIATYDIIVFLKQRQTVTKGKAMLFSL